MLAIAPSRAWNYQDGVYTITLYADPQPVNGIQPIIGLIASGTLTNALSGQEIGGIGVTHQPDGYHVNTFVSLSTGTAGAVPGTPLLVANTLVQGAVTTPYVGITENVTTVSNSIPGSPGCAMGVVAGATVQYTFQNQTYTISYVPGCGIVNFTTPTGDTFYLQSIATYPQLGQLAIGTRISDASYLDLVRSMVRRALHRMP